jgi:hypothetical protein
LRPYFSARPHKACWARFRKRQTTNQKVPPLPNPRKRPLQAFQPFDRYRRRLDHSGSQWITVDHSGSQWIVDHSGSQWTRPSRRRRRRPGKPRGARSSSDRVQIEFRSSSDRVQIEFRSSSDRVQIELRSSSDRVQIEFRSSSDQVQIEFRSSSDRVQIEFRSSSGGSPAGPGFCAALLLFCVRPARRPALFFRDRIALLCTLTGSPAQALVRHGRLGRTIGPAHPL